ncbi:hypothetical protein VSR82_36165 [Burkholderia sp. JPY481]
MSAQLLMVISFVFIWRGRGSVEASSSSKHSFSALPNDAAFLFEGAVHAAKTHFEGRCEKGVFLHHEPNKLVKSTCAFEQVNWCA